MIDALTPAAAAGREAASAETAVGDALALMAVAARVGAAATSDMTAAVGRARYSDDRSRGVPDPGATTVALIFEAWAAAAEDQCREDG